MQGGCAGGTGWTKNLIQCGSAYHRSLQVNFLSITCSHFVHASCGLVPTALLVHSSRIAPPDVAGFSEGLLLLFGTAVTS